MILISMNIKDSINVLNLTVDIYFTNLKQLKVIDFMINA